MLPLGGMLQGSWTKVLVGVLGLLALSACSATLTPAPIRLNGGNYTPLGGVAKNSQPTASDIADLEAAENGALGMPALVEFYADY